MGGSCWECVESVDLILSKKIENFWENCDADFSHNCAWFLQVCSKTFFPPLQCIGHVQNGIEFEVGNLVWEPYNKVWGRVGCGEHGHSFLTPMSLQCYSPLPLASLTHFSFPLPPLSLTFTVSQQHTINCFCHYSCQSYLLPFTSSSTRIHSLGITVITLAWKHCSNTVKHSSVMQGAHSTTEVLLPTHTAGGSLLSSGRAHRCYALCPFFCTVPQKTDQMFCTFALFWLYLTNEQMWDSLFRLVRKPWIVAF